MQVTYSTSSTTPAPLVLCSDSRCQIGSCASQATQENGFNSSCKQCLAERAAAEGSNSFTQMNPYVLNDNETSFSPDRKSLDRSRSRLDFSPIHDESNEPTASLATSVLSTKNLVESSDEPRGTRMHNSKPGRTYECEDLCRKGSMIFFSTVGMTIITVGYIVLGAIIFSNIEAKYLSEKLSLQHKAADRDSPTAMNSTKLAVEIISRPRSPDAKPSASGPLQYPNLDHWNFSGGLLYYLTLLITIGKYLAISK